MSRQRYILISVFFFLMFSMRVAFACWIIIPLEKVVERKPVVVVGKIVKIEVDKAPHNTIYRVALFLNTIVSKITRTRLAEPGFYRYDIAYIEVAKILKNELRKPVIKVGDQILLSMPSINNTVGSSADIRYKKGKEGVWILQYRDGTFWAMGPNDLQPLNQQKIITQIIHSQKQMPPAKG